MSRYFFHLVDSIDVLLDPEGVEIAAEQVAPNAMKQARSLIAADVLLGEIDLHYRIEVRDSQGAVVHDLGFADAVDVKALA